MYAHFGNNKHTQTYSNLCIIYFYIPSTLIVFANGDTWVGRTCLMLRLGRVMRGNAHFLMLSKLRPASYFRMFDDVAMGFAFEGIPEPNLNLMYDLGTRLSAGKRQMPLVCIHIGVPDVEYSCIQALLVLT